MRKRTIICNGIEYPTLKEFAAATNISPSTIQARLRTGLTPEEVIKVVNKRKKGAFVPCTPSDYNCLHCTKPDCCCNLPPAEGETKAGDILSVHFGSAPAFAKLYHCTLASSKMR